MAAKTWRDIDKGWTRLARDVFGGAQIGLEVGIFGANGERMHDGSTVTSGGQTVAGRKPSTLTVLQVGVFNEFGLGVPERSFIRSYFDANSARLVQITRKLMVSVIDGKRTKQQIVDILGLRMVGEIQAGISNGIPPPNAPATIAKKGSSKPLIDTGQLRASISYRLRPT